MFIVFSKDNNKVSKTISEIDIWLSILLSDLLLLLLIMFFKVISRQAASISKATSLFSLPERLYGFVKAVIQKI